jgi:alpha-L-fucosidase
MFVNSEAIYSVRPWIISNEGAVWFTKRKDQDTIYAMVDLEKPWQYGKWQDIVLHSVKATSTTEVEILGANGKIVEYEPEVDPKPEWHMDQNGLHLHLMKTQRLQDNRKWPNPVVVRITHVEPGFVVPRVLTVSAKADESSRSYVLSGGLANMADSTPVNVGFEYRAIGENDVHVRSGLWTFIPVTLLKDNGTFSYTLRDLPPGNYEFHAVAKHPLITLDGTDLIFRIQ